MTAIQEQKPIAKNELRSALEKGDGPEIGPQLKGEEIPRVWQLPRWAQHQTCADVDVHK
jgi:hypothetical protein